jgi:hypothetical protein
MPFEMAWSLSVIRVPKPETQTVYDYSVWPMLKLVNRIVLLLLLTGPCILALCQDQEISRSSNAPLPEYVQEFFLSDAVRSQEKGELQITFGVDSRHGSGTNAFVKSEFGLTDRLQVSAEVPYGEGDEDIPAPPPNWSMPTLGVQYQIIHGQVPFSLTAGVDVELPLGSSRGIEWEPSIIAARAFGKMQVHASVSANIQAAKPSFESNLASVYSIDQRWFPTLELTAKQVRGNYAFYVTPGFYRHFKHRLEVGVGAPLGIGVPSTSVGIVTKINWEVGGGNRQPE